MEECIINCPYGSLSDATCSWCRGEGEEENEEVEEE